MDPEGNDNSGIGEKRVARLKTETGVHFQGSQAHDGFAVELEFLEAGSSIGFHAVMMFYC